MVWLLLSSCDLNTISYVIIRPISALPSSPPPPPKKQRFSFNSFEFSSVSFPPEFKFSTLAFSDFRPSSDDADEMTQLRTSPPLPRWTRSDRSSRSRSRKFSWRALRWRSSSPSCSSCCSSAQSPSGKNLVIYSIKNSILNKHFLAPREKS